jgi:hypothetical protein
MTESVAPFITSFATQQLLPPWEAEATIYGFGFKIPKSAIREYVDRYFNATEPQPRRFQFDPIPRCNFGVLLYSDIRNAGTQTANTHSHSPQPYGKLNYKEVVVCVPISRRNISVQNVLSTPIYEWCQPIAVCDSDAVIFSAREIIGLDVLPGNIYAADLEDGGFKLTVQLYGVKHFSPTSKETLVPLLEVDVPPNSFQDQPPDRRAEGVVQLISEVTQKSNTTMVGDCLPQRMQVVALKQFRDAHKMDMAIYQALVTFLISRHSAPDARTVQTFMNEKKVAITLSDNATTREIVQTFLGQPPPAGKLECEDGKDVWENVGTAQHPTLAFRLRCKIEVNQVKTDFTLS